MNLYLLKFNNYYNRIIKRHNTIEEYTSDPSAVILGVFDNINFNPNDGIQTEQIINYSGEEMPDYCLVVDNGVIQSRWYIIENIRTRNWQFKIQVYRDLIADFYANILSAPCFIEKATVSMYDPAIYNNEDLTFNQIKKSEKLIKDRSRSAWYVGYVAKGETASVTVPLSTGKIDGTYPDFGSYPFNQYKDTPLYTPGRDFTFKTYYYGLITEAYVQGWDENGNWKAPQLDAGGMSGKAGVCPYKEHRGYQWIFGKNFQSVADKYYIILDSLADEGFSWTYGLTLPTATQRGVDEFLSEIGKTYQIGEKYYEIGLRYEIERKQVDFNATDSYGYNFVDLAARNEALTTTYKGSIGSVEYETTGLYITYTEVYVDQINFTLSLNRATTDDAPYDIFAIPAGRISLGADLSPTDPALSKRIIDALILSLGSKLYDIQLLPYAPLEDRYISDPGPGNVPILLTDEFPSGNKVYFEEIKPEGKAAPNSLIIYATASNFNKIASENISPPATPIEFKISNECDLYRLVSPNYNGQFEFSITKNRGVTQWNISTSFKPFTPYIRVAPEFGGLYGRNFGDARGLICGGDFSLSQISDAWINYQINNKNFQVMFDRQIQNMEVNNSVQRTREIVNAFTGTVQGAAGGAAAGAFVGDPIGMAVGAGVGAVASAAGGIADLTLNERLRREAMDYTKDQFGYQLQNIQALPYSLTKVGVQNSDYKLFPFLEYYTCSDIEKDALRNKIKYNGMTIMRIGTIEEFIQPERTYIKGKLIRLESISDDYHIVNQISKELNEGIYI